MIKLEYFGLPGFVFCVVGVFFGLLLLQEYNQAKFFSLPYVILVAIFTILGARGIFMGLMPDVI